MKFLLIGIVTCLSVLHFVKADNFEDFGMLIKVANKVCDELIGKMSKYNVNLKKSRIAFELRTPCKRIQQKLSQPDLMSNVTEFDHNKMTVVFVSGWTTKMNEDYTEEMTKAFNCRGGNNFIVVNTGGYIASKTYYPAAYFTRHIGEIVAEGLMKLNVSSENIHLIGHSLGAHIVGSAGRTYEKLTGNKVGRITGLDPARPCFINKGHLPRLGINDASYVDIIHSNNKEAGIEIPIGHADFYPNGKGAEQPGCLMDTFCHHKKSLWYFIETIYNGNEQNFIGNQCSQDKTVRSDVCQGEKAAMGYSANAKGVFMLNVNKKAPYGRNAKRSASRNLENCGVCQK